MTAIKSICAVQNRQVKGGGYKLVVKNGQGLWNVRVRYADGTERLLCDTFIYTLAQAQAAIKNYSEV